MRPAPKYLGIPTPVSASDPGLFSLPERKAPQKRAPWMAL